MSCQTDFPQNVLSLINSDRILRINPNMDNDNFELDNHQKIPTLIELAKKEFTKRNKDVDSFFKD